MSVANVERFWEKMRGFEGIEFFQQFIQLVRRLPPDTVASEVIALASREGFEFSSQDYRTAVLKVIEAQPNTAQDLAITYREVVADGRWFEVVDGVGG